MVLTVSQRKANTAALAATGVAIATLLPVAAHQLGFCDHLRDPPGAIFDSDTITESSAAHPFGIPDGLLGIVSYIATFALLLAARRLPIVRPFLRAKLTLDASAAAGNALRQVVKFRRICSYCAVTSLATAAIVHYGRRSVDT